MLVYFVTIIVIFLYQNKSTLFSCFFSESTLESNHIYWEGGWVRKVFSIKNEDKVGLNHFDDTFWNNFCLSHSWLFPCTVYFCRWQSQLQTHLLSGEMKHVMIATSDRKWTITGPKKRRWRTQPFRYGGSHRKNR